MPTVPIHLPSPQRSAPPSPLPPLLQTPLGYALLELQGTINFPAPSSDSTESSTEVGRLVFPDYDPTNSSDGTEMVEEGPWMKRVWLFVGFQRMTGSVVKLGKPLAVLRRKRPEGEEMQVDGEAGAGEDVGEASTIVGKSEELEIVDIVKWKIVFRSRPEPVGLAAE